MRVVVAGGAGDLGSRVIRELKDQGHEAVSASRRSGVDLVSGVGLHDVLIGADAVVNCADAPTRGTTVTVDAVGLLAHATAARGIPLVHISIVGIDGFPMGYYRRKLAAEEAIRAVGGPATVLRATQFHSLAARVAGALGHGPVGMTVGRAAVQPVDIDHVARRLAELALGTPPAAYVRARDVAGPEVLTLEELTTLVRAHRGRPPQRVVRLPAFLPALRALADRGIVPPAGTADLGGRPFADWLADRPR